jgi:epoxyqueuosine reductase QueG
MSTDNLSALVPKLAHRAYEMGARIFGAADLTQARTAITAQGGEFLARFPRALSVGVALDDGIVDQLDHHKQVAIARTYDYLYYTVNRKLDDIALTLSAIINKCGFRSLLIPASDTLDKEKSIGLFSHKLAARLAGLGWIGPSCLLITPEVGPRVRLVTVLTDAPLETGSIVSNRCGDCRLCVDACPPKAFTGRIFHEDEPRKERFDVQRCIDYRTHLQEKVTGARVCGMCIHACPFGREQIAS